MGEEEKELLAAVTCPQLFMPAGGDAPSTKTGGLAEEVLGHLVEIEEFPHMQHGWAVRGGETLAAPTAQTAQPSLPFRHERSGGGQRREEGNSRNLTVLC